MKFFLITTSFIQHWLVSNGQFVRWLVSVDKQSNSLWSKYTALAVHIQFINDDQIDRIGLWSPAVCWNTEKYILEIKAVFIWFLFFGCKNVTTFFCKFASEREQTHWGFEWESTLIYLTKLTSQQDTGTTPLPEQFRELLFGPIVVLGTSLYHEAASEKINFIKHLTVGDNTLKITEQKERISYLRNAQADFTRRSLPRIICVLFLFWQSVELFWSTDHLECVRKWLLL